MRFIATLSILSISFCSTSFGQTDNLLEIKGKKSPDSAQLSKNSRIDAEMRSNLDKPLAFNFDDTPWREVEEFLEKELEINIVLTRSAIDDSLGADEPITFRMRGINLRSSLRLMLVSKNATFVVKDNVIKIISLDDEEAPRYFNNHFIDVRTLLAKISDLEKSRIGTPRLIREDTGGGGKMVGVPSPVLLKTAGEVTAESMLIDLIQTSVSSDQWKDAGNGMATIKIIGGYVVVGCQDSLADSVTDFLQDLAYHLSR